MKNGPPKIQTGGGEFSIEEWDKLLEEVDGALDAFKEELRERIAKAKAKELLSNDTEKTALANAADDTAEDEGAPAGQQFYGFDLREKESTLFLSGR